MVIEKTELTVLADRIKTANQNANDCAKKAVLFAIECGNALTEAKAKVKHGQWLNWLESNCDMSERKAQKYMKLASDYPKLDNEKAQRVADLSIREAVKLLSESKPTRGADLILSEPSEPEEENIDWLPENSDLASVSFDSLDLDWLLVQQSQKHKGFYYVVYLLGSNIEFSIKPIWKYHVGVSIFSMLPGRHTTGKEVKNLEWDYLTGLDADYLKKIISPHLPKGYEHLAIAE